MDIRKVIGQLQAAGLTQVEIAERAGLAQSTVSGLFTGARGKRVSLQTAEALHRLWMQVCGRRRKVAAANDAQGRGAA